MLAEAGVDWIGFPLRLDVHAEDLSEAEAARVIGALPPGVEGVLITYDPSALRIRSLARALGVQIVQIHGEMPLEELKQLRCLAPDLRIIKSIVLGAPEWREPVARMRQFLPFVHGFITDTYDPGSGARGATGKRHDWRISRKLVEECPKPVILAGGLTPENVGVAVRAVRPAGVDCHTGVEQADGAKSPSRVRQFCTLSRSAATPSDRG